MTPTEILSYLEKIGLTGVPPFSVDMELSSEWELVENPLYITLYGCIPNLNYDYKEPYSLWAKCHTPYHIRPQ